MLLMSLGCADVSDIEASQTEMSDQIELHDSCVAVERDNRLIVLLLCPAYVHHWDQVDGGWAGEGRHQAAELMLSDGTVSRDIEGARDVSDGWLEVGMRYENILPVPLSILGAVRGRLELVGAPSIEFSARGVVIRLIGEPEFVEYFLLIVLPTWRLANHASANSPRASASRSAIKRVA